MIKRGANTCDDFEWDKVGHGHLKNKDLVIFSLVIFVFVKFEINGLIGTLISWRSILEIISLFAKKTSLPY